MRAWLGAACALALACGAGTEDGPVVLAEEARYRVTAESGSANELRVEVRTTGGWKIAPEAPARLDLAEGDVTFAEPALREEHQQARTETGFAFATAVSADTPGRHTATGQLKFGICEGPKAKCFIIREALEIPVEVARAD